MKKISENIDYVYLYPEDSQTFIDIKLISGKYSGTIYRYGRVSVDEEKDSAVLSFEYDIIESPYTEESLRNSEFKNYIGDILVNIMLGGINETGIDYTEEFDL